MNSSDPVPSKPAGSYRLLHTADWHLGKPLDQLSREEEHARFLDWLLEAVKENEVDAIVLAGDVFDTANPPQSALTRYYDFVHALNQQGGCTLAIIGGNHDSAAQLEAPKQVLHALRTHVAGGLADDPGDRILCLPDEDNPAVALALVPFLRDRDLRVGRAGESNDEIRDNLAAGIHQCYEDTAAAAEGLDCPLIGTGHLTVTGASRSESERDIHIGGLGAVSSDTFSSAYSYVALGHLHRPQATDTAGLVRYAGSPIALSFSEVNDTKEVRILDVAGNELSHYSLPVPVFRRLAQLRTKRASLEDDLAGFQPEDGELTTWVEVVVEDASLETDINEQVRELAEDRDFEILKVVRGRTAPAAGQELGDYTDDEAIESLLDRPGDVFDHLLKQHDEFSKDEVEALKTAFDILHDRYNQAQ